MQRTEVRQILQAWQAHSMDELAVWQWGEKALAARLEHGDEQDELVADIVDLLAALPYEMVLLDDVPVFLDALANPAAETDLSINLLWNHMDGVDVDTRRHQYQSHFFYGQFANAD